MTKRMQTNKNLDLSAKAAEYIAKNPEATKDFAGKISFVVFSANDKVLNRNNEDLAKRLKSKGLNIVKAQQTKDKREPWKFTSV